MAEPPPVPRVGVGVLVFKGNKFLVGQRKGSHGAGTWALPGGHLEFGESWEECAKREVEEETGLVLRNITFAHVNNNVMSDKLHYITIFMRAEVPEDAEAKVMEPHKCERWDWMTWPECPRPVFMPLEQLLARAADGTFSPFPAAAA